MDVKTWISYVYEAHLAELHGADFDVCQHANCQLAYEMEQTLARVAELEQALVNLFQACSGLCLDDMNKIEKEINEASAAIGQVTA